MFGTSRVYDGTFPVDPVFTLPAINKKGTRRRKRKFYVTFIDNVKTFHSVGKNDPHVSNCKLEEKETFLLMFADDIVLISTPQLDLRQMNNRAYVSEQIGLKVDIT